MLEKWACRHQLEAGSKTRKKNHVNSWVQWTVLVSIATFFLQGKFKSLSNPLICIVLWLKVVGYKVDIHLITFVWECCLLMVTESLLHPNIPDPKWNYWAGHYIASTTTKTPVGEVVVGSVLMCFGIGSRSVE